MKASKFLLGVIAGLLAISSPATAQSVVHERAFSGQTQLESSWNRYNGPFGSSANTCFNSNNIAVTGGKLVLSITKSSNKCGRLYSSGGVSAPGWQTGQTYGRWEFVAKYPSVKGTTGYIGLYGKNNTNEVVIEHVPSEPGNLHLAQHYTSGNKKYEAKILGGANWGNETHKYTIDWLPNGQIKFSIDGVLRHTMQQKFNTTPMYLSFGTGAYNCKAWGGCPEQFNSKLPTAMTVGSLKVWKY